MPVENQRKEDLKILDEAVKKLDAVATDAKDALEDARAKKQKDDDKKIIVDATTPVTPLSSALPPPAPLDIFETCGDVVQPLMLKWFDTKDKEFAKRELKVKKNLNGYRTYTWKNIRRPGKYNVRLYDPDQEEIGRHDFTIAKKN